MQHTVRDSEWREVFVGGATRAPPRSAPVATVPRHDVERPERLPGRPALPLLLPRRCARAPTRLPATSRSRACPSDFRACCPARRVPPVYSPLGRPVLAEPVFRSACRCSLAHYRSVASKPRSSCREPARCGNLQRSHLCLLVSRRLPFSTKTACSVPRTRLQHHLDAMRGSALIRCAGGWKWQRRWK